MRVVVTSRRYCEIDGKMTEMTKWVVGGVRGQWVLGDGGSG
jgi:hypothetical protein